MMLPDASYWYASADQLLGPLFVCGKRACAGIAATTGCGVAGVASPARAVPDSSSTPAIVFRMCFISLARDAFVGDSGGYGVFVKAETSRAHSNGFRSVEPHACRVAVFLDADSVVVRTLAS
jgi:hypothetical protein